MTLRTLGTNAQTTLSGFVVGFNDMIPADIATLNTQILADSPGYNAWNNVAATGLVVTTANATNTIGTVQPLLNQPYVRNGTLFIPGRGQLVLKNGDFVGWDSTTGWPIVVSGQAAAVAAVWVHS